MSRIALLLAVGYVAGWVLSTAVVLRVFNEPHDSEDAYHVALTWSLWPLWVAVLVPVGLVMLAAAAVGGLARALLGATSEEARRG